MSVIPDGYSRTSRLNGADAYPGDRRREVADAAVDVYTKDDAGYEERGRSAIQLVRWPSPNVVLPATEEVDGVEIPSRLRGATARYHDGWWTPIDGEISWVTDMVHSVSITDSSHTVAVRGPVHIDSSRLLRIAEANW